MKALIACSALVLVAGCGGGRHANASKAALKQLRHERAEVAKLQNDAPFARDDAGIGDYFVNNLASQLDDLMQEVEADIGVFENPDASDFKVDDWARGQAEADAERVDWELSFLRQDYETASRQLLEIDDRRRNISDTIDAVNTGDRTASAETLAALTQLGKEMDALRELYTDADSITILGKVTVKNLPPEVTDAVANFDHVHHFLSLTDLSLDIQAALTRARLQYVALDDAVGYS